MDLNKIGKFIMQLRQEQGLTQKELADKLSVTNKAVSRWETGKGMPDSSLLAPLAETLGVSVNELLAGERGEDEKIATIANEMLVAMKKKAKRYKKILIVAGIVVALILTCVLIWYNSNTYKGYDYISYSAVSQDAGLEVDMIFIKESGEDLYTSLYIRVESTRDHEDIGYLIGITGIDYTTPDTDSIWLSMFDSFTNTPFEKGDVLEWMKYEIRYEESQFEYLVNRIGMADSPTNNSLNSIYYNLHLEESNVRLTDRIIAMIE